MDDSEAIALLWRSNDHVRDYYVNDKRCNCGGCFVCAIQHIAERLTGDASEKMVPLSVVLKIIEDEPLGYRTEGEHEKLENFCDRIAAKILSLSNTTVSQCAESAEAQKPSRKPSS